MRVCVCVCVCVDFFFVLFYAGFTSSSSSSSSFFFFFFFFFFVNIFSHVASEPVPACFQHPAGRGQAVALLAMPLPSCREPLQRT